MVSPVETSTRQKSIFLLENQVVAGRMRVYLLMVGGFFGLSALTIYILHNFFLDSRILLDSRLFSLRVITGLVSLLLLYFLSDGLRLSMVVRAMGQRLPFRFLMKLVFVNIFFSNTTPMATGGGFVQIYFLNRKGFSIGEATAATSIRTMIAALIMLTVVPVFFVVKSDLFDPFRNGKIHYYFAGVAVLYLVVLFIILFRVRTLRVLLFRTMRFCSRKGLMSRHRFRIFFIKLSRELRCFSNGFRCFVKGPPPFVLGAFFSTGLYLLTLFSFSIVLITGLEYDVPASTILAIQAVVTFFMYFTPTPGAVGLAESAYMLLFSRIVGQVDITLLTISWRFLTIYVGVLIGIMIACSEVLKLRPGRSQ
jgi:uncharacterized protein (TIRG00374 family)